MNKETRNCKQCDKLYTVCQCGCQFCADYWLRCPRCFGAEGINFKAVRSHSIQSPASCECGLDDVNSRTCPVHTYLKGL